MVQLASQLKFKALHSEEQLLAVKPSPDACSDQLRSFGCSQTRHESKARWVIGQEAKGKAVRRWWRAWRQVCTPRSHEGCADMTMHRRGSCSCGHAALGEQE